MKGGEWRRDEVEAVADDHLAMLAAELSGIPYSKAAHRRALAAAKRLIEVETTKYGSLTPFFATRNEVLVSERRAPSCRLYRLHAFRQAPRLCTLAGAPGETCGPSAASFTALPR